MYAYRIAYDGTPFHGFQRQPDVATVEDTLLDALESLDVIGADEDLPPGYAAAGRTDAGVSALAQTVAFATPGWLTPEAINSRLPASVRAWARAEVPPDVPERSVQFHATHHARSREYTYLLHAPSTALASARELAERLSGEYDFHNLTPDEQGTVRDLTIGVDRDGEFLVFTLRAGGFPRQLVRRLLGLVDGVLGGDIGGSHVERVLSSTSLSGPDGIGPAPAEPLVLTDVSYPGLSFGVDGTAANRSHKLFEQLRVERSTGARVASLLGTVGDGIDPDDGC
jgi:tRNA pseudouridine38-40 synthase